MMFMEIIENELGFFTYFKNKGFTFEHKLFKFHLTPRIVTVQTQINSKLTKTISSRLIIFC